MRRRTAPRDNGEDREVAGDVDQGPPPDDTVPQEFTAHAGGVAYPTRRTDWGTISGGHIHPPDIPKVMLTAGPIAVVCLPGRHLEGDVVQGDACAKASAEMGGIQHRGFRRFGFR